VASIRKRNDLRLVQTSQIVDFLRVTGRVRLGSEGRAAQGNLRPNKLEPGKSETL